MTPEKIEVMACTAYTAYFGRKGERGVFDGVVVTEERGAVQRSVSRRIRQRPEDATSDGTPGDYIYIYIHIASP